MFKKDKLKDLHYSVSGVLTAAEISDASDKILEKYGEKAKIAGFRPGHVPMAELRRRYGPDATQDAINNLINADLETFVKDKKIRLAAAPKANLDKFVPDGDAEYSLEFDILPELPKIDLEKFTLTKKEKPVTDADINKSIENIRKNRGTFEKQDDANYKLSDGDMAIIDFKGFVNEEAFDGGEAKNHNLVLGSNTFIPGFEDQIVGHKLGDEFDVNVKFPDDYRAENLKGKAARFAVKINEVKKSVLPVLDDEFAKSVGMDSVEKLRDRIRELLVGQNTDLVKDDMRNELLDLLTDKVKLELPESLIESELKSVGKVEDEKKARKGAERRVKLGLILAEWGQANNVTVTREELQSAIWAEASRYPNPQEVYEYYNKTPDAVSMLNGMVFERKTLDAMIEKCGVKK